MDTPNSATSDVGLHTFRRIQDARAVTEGGHFSGRQQTRVREIAADAPLPAGATEVVAETPCHDWQEESE